MNVYGVPVFTVEPNECDVCLRTSGLVMAARQPRAFVNLCKPHIENARAMFLHDVLTVRP